MLINAYAVSPSWGSEPGVGWNWVTRIANYCEVNVITEGEWRDEILAALESLPQRDRLHFYFLPVSERVRSMCWNQGDWRFYFHYARWQRRALKLARQIVADYHIDVMHQLNMIGFREPGYLWRIPDIPLVWGPIGNMSPLRSEFLAGSSFHVLLKNKVKNVVSWYEARTGRVRKMIRRADHMFAVLKSTKDIIRDVYNVDNVEVLSETGLSSFGCFARNHENSGVLKLLWVGRFIPTKKLDLMLRIMSKLEHKEAFELHIVGWGTADEENYYRQMAKTLGVDDRCSWYGKIPNDSVQQMMRQSDIFVFTSVVEGTPSVVLEAIANNLPVVCFDLCGQGVVVTDEIGVKVHVDSTMTHAEDVMVGELNRLESNRSELVRYSQRCEARKLELSWESKIKSVVECYYTMVNRRSAVITK